MMSNVLGKPEIELTGNELAFYVYKEQGETKKALVPFSSLKKYRLGYSDRIEFTNNLVWLDENFNLCVGDFDNYVRYKESSGLLYQQQYEKILEMGLIAVKMLKLGYSLGEVVDYLNEM